MPLLVLIPFIHPAIAAIALPLGIVPILIHLINRRRYVRVPWAAMSFLLAANRRSVRRVRLEQWLLLAVRAGVIVLFGLALARPYFPPSALLPVDAARVHRVILLDNSVSMNARTSSGKSRFQVAKEYAERLVESFPPADAVSIVTLARPAEAVIGQAAYDRRFVRERLASVEGTQRGADAAAALRAAVDIVKASPFAPANRAVYLISDLPRSAWVGEAKAGPTPAVLAARQVGDLLIDPATSLTFVDVASGESGNVAVSRLALESGLVGVNSPARITTEVTNTGASSAREVGLQVRRDGKIIRSEVLPRIQAGRTAVATLTTEFSTPGSHLIEARISPPADDALRDDDARYLSVEVRAVRPVLVVDGSPGPTPLSGQSGFLVTALAPKTAGADSTVIQPRVITQPELTGEALSDYDVVVLCDVHRLSEEMWKNLQDFVKAGGGLLVFAGELVSAENYNRFGHAAGQGLIPARADGVRTTTSDADKFVGFSLSEPVHPIVAEFVGHPESGLFAARVDQYLSVAPDAPKAEVVLRYTTGDAALVGSSFGKGRVLFCTTTANMDWTNLPAKGDYVSIVLNAVAYLSPRHGEHRNVTVGQSVREPLSPVESSMPLRVVARQDEVADSGAERAAEQPALVPEGTGLAMEYGPIEHAGGLAISIGAEIRSFAANIDPAESDLATVNTDELIRAVDRPLRVVGDLSSVVESPAAVRSAELASLALYAVVAMLLAETAMAMRFGSERAGGRRKKGGRG